MKRFSILAITLCAICDNCVDSGNKVGENFIFMPYLEIRRNISEE